ncbi:glycoside hydrolase family 16 protein [Mongoliitalea daihaiensis]|uniref:glycoside hydrolase family 16 protein n=1 Tax=Mongoliitalea daihaiensis TaxID=2782006 RepID=UPI001F429B47|nr:glycoside hydrolase family 16 protein [Mongoliitalea daihaiensis]UJP63756.1 glycoside hydrolase family 16 protein [Mongoliitalea daihaiensis]
MKGVKFKQILLLFLAAALLWGCEQEEVDLKVLLPTNLQIEVEQGERGNVTVSFSAQNANFFRVGFGVDEQLPELATGNQMSFTYREAGTFTITVQAHTTENDFISDTRQVEISSAALGLGIPTTGFVSPESYEGYRLVWRDEFNGSALSQDWTYDLGDGCANSLCGWGNNELQWYTDRRENVRLEGGNLIITARRENLGGRQFTSSRIKTEGRQSFQFGRIDIRAVLPKGQGIWPALWMLGDNIRTVGWPACGEIDIMEMVGGPATARNNEVHGTVHWDNNGSWANTGGSTTLRQGIFNDNFHVFSIIWDEQRIVWLLDNVAFHTVDITPAALSELRESFFFLFNIAVGGNWPGDPDGTTTFPQQMVVDYVRVFQRL